MTTPINEDKAEVRRELLKVVNNPTPASTVEGLEKALEEWRTNKRLFTEADGTLPDSETMRLAFVAMLPHETYTYVSLHVDMAEYDNLMKLEKFVLKYSKLLLSRKRPRPAHVIEHESKEASSHLADEPGGGETHDGYYDPPDYDPEFLQQCASVLNLDAFDPAGRSDILAFMRGRFNPRASGPPRPGASPAYGPPASRGPAGRFTGAAQGGGGFRAAGVAPRLPPRDVKDMSCVNCGKKGHMARDCRQPRQEDKSKRP
jgi:hypothetical protein